MATTHGVRAPADPRFPSDTLPAGARDARRGDEGRPTSALVLLRFTLLIATSYMLLAAEGFAGVSPLLSVWIGVGLASNVVTARRRSRTAGAWPRS
jgi:hypothetical protein